MSFSFSFSLSCSLSSFLLSLSFFSSFSSCLEWHSKDHDHGSLHVYTSKHLLSLRLQSKGLSRSRSGTYKHFFFIEFAREKLQRQASNATLMPPRGWKIVHWRARAGNGHRIVTERKREEDNARWRRIGTLRRRQTVCCSTDRRRARVRSTWTGAVIRTTSSSGSTTG